MRKSVSKRIRITRTGKIIRRPMGTDHFRTRQTTKNVRNKGKNRSLDYPLKNVLSV